MVTFGDMRAPEFLPSGPSGPLGAHWAHMMMIIIMVQHRFLMQQVAESLVVVQEPAPIVDLV